VPSASTVIPPEPEFPVSYPVPLEGTITKNSAERSLPDVVVECAKLNVPSRPCSEPSKRFTIVATPTGVPVETAGVGATSVGANDSTLNSAAARMPGSVSAGPHTPRPDGIGAFLRPRVPGPTPQGWMAEIPPCDEEYPTMTSAARSGGSVAGDGLGVDAVAEPGDTRAETIANGRLLDADPIGGFDRLTRLAAVLTAAPSSFLAFVSAQRAVRTSSFGIDDAGAGQELPLSESLCAEVVEVDGPVLVDDVDGHPRSRALPVVAQLGLAAWAGFPVRDARGLALGALCVVDTRRRGWSEHHRDVLETLAQAASGEIGLRLALWEARVAQNASSRRADEADRQAVAAGRAAREFHDRARAAALQAETSEQLAAKAQRLARLAEQHAAEADELAATLRESLLPARLPRFPRLDVAARYRAGSGASVLGDFYDLFPTPSGWGAVVGDVCGKGATAARTTALSRSTVRALGHTDDDPAAVLAALHGVLHVWFDQRPSFVTAVYVSLAPGPGGRGLAAAVASAGHPEAVVLRRTGTVEVLGGGGRALGVGPDPIIATETVVLDHGDRLVLCTDGITEARSPQGEQFETEGIVAALGALDPSVGVDEVADALLGATLAHAVGSATDDTALMILGAAQ